MKAYREGRAKGLDGIPLHFTSYGEGEPALVCCNGVGVSTFFWKYVVRYFSQRHQVVTWDYRSHGRSGRVDTVTREKFTVATSVRDLKAVMDELGLKKAVLLGHSMGTQVILEMWRRHPSRVAGLVMVCGAFGRPLDTFWNSRLSAPIFDVVYQIVNTAPRTFGRVNRWLMRSRLPMFFSKFGAVDNRMCRPEDLKPYFDHLAVVDPQVFFLMAGEMQRHTAINWLEKVSAPTLVIAGERDRFTPFHLSVQMRDRIPEAELLTIPHGSHVAQIEQPELVNLRLEKFVRERVMSPSEAARDAAAESEAAHEEHQKEEHAKPRRKAAAARKRAVAAARRARLRLVE
jgi:pimeloyl-ACP methyl ester carboxylesterase